jgi:hypothetical protein
MSRDSGIFKVIQNLYLFILVFLSEHVMMFCGNVIRKHCSKVSGELCETVKCIVDMYWQAVEGSGERYC